MLRNLLTLGVPVLPYSGFGDSEFLSSRRPSGRDPTAFDPLFSHSHHAPAVH